MQNHLSWHLLRDLAVAGFVAAGLSAMLIRALMPVLVRYALARPNARSSHIVPTPQGGGIAVVAATLAVTVAATLLLPELFNALLSQHWIVFAAVIALAIVGCIDDIYAIAAWPRLALQFLAVIAIVAVLPAELQIVPGVPLWIERAFIVLAGVWFVNLVNFMDGIDWMTVVEGVTITIGICIIALIGALPPVCLLVALALLGATIGFAPFNRPVARLFLGDVGSLPIGLLLFWLLLQLAGNGHIFAALLLPLYYVADATVTLLRRAIKGERLTQAHRSHFYQRATERGMSVPAVLTRVAMVNVTLVALALLSVWMASLAVNIVALATGGVVVAILLFSLSRGKR
jgi:UDP-N-acetylmuramyl pentapeptide phosphotransferase/UDP-N-acetylglucosamine-1-phosphate transferase